MPDGAVLLVLAAAASGLTAGLDWLLLARTHAGTDNALRLAAILTYVGVDASYTLARALGLTALVFSYLAVVAGLLASVRRAQGRDPGRVTGLVHRQAGLITVVLVAGHAAVPYSSAYSPYGGWTTALVPFAQPVSWGMKAATWESLGILAFYLAVLIGPTFYLFGRRRRWWWVLHRMAAAVYVLSVIHAFFLGTDFLVRGPARVALLAAQVPLLVLTAGRLAAGPGSGVPVPGSSGPGGPAAVSSAGRRGRALGTGAALASAAALTALTILVATGMVAAGMRL